MKGLVKITDKLVPIMTVTYIFISLLVMIFHVGNIGTMILEIFRAAFTGQAAVGGFTGVTVVAAVRWGLARGVSSNDAGLGVSASMQAQAESIDHPAQQGMWAVIETFLVTIIICSLTGFMILSTGVWQNGRRRGDLCRGCVMQYLRSGWPVDLYSLPVPFWTQFTGGYRAERKNFRCLLL